MVLIAGTLVISTKEPVITQTALLPSGHASSTLQAWRPVNVSAAECLTSSLLNTFLHTRQRLNTKKNAHTLTQITEVMSKHLHWIMFKDQTRLSVPKLLERLLYETKCH